MEKTSVEVIRRVFNDDEGVFIEVGPDSEGLSLIEIRTTEPKSVEWYGKIRLPMSRELALKLGQTLVAAATDNTK